MTESKDEARDPLAPILAILKEPSGIGPDFTARVMAEIETLTPRRSGRWWQRRWTIQVSPLGGLAAAAGIVAVLLTGRLAGRPDASAAADVAAGAGAHLTQFVLIAPDAGAVIVVGDFNDWSASATPLARNDGNGVWWVTVPLEPGRYRYAFVVDGNVWRPDPEAPSLDDEFGRTSSVVTIGGA